MNYQHIIFDLDGTLVDSSTEIHEAAMLVCRDHKLDIPTQDYIREKTGSPPTQFFLDHGCHPADAESMVAKFRQHLADNAGNPECVVADVPSVLSRLRDAELRISLATTKPTKLASLLLQRYGLLTYFSHVQGTDPPLKHKPHPDIILKCVSYAPDLTAAMVGDTTFDIDAAHQAGIVSVGYGKGAHGGDRLLGACPSYMINSMSELLGVLGIQA